MDRRQGDEPEGDECEPVVVKLEVLTDKVRDRWPRNVFNHAAWFSSQCDVAARSSGIAMKRASSPQNK